MPFITACLCWSERPEAFQGSTSLTLIALDRIAKVAHSHPYLVRQIAVQAQLSSYERNFCVEHLEHERMMITMRRYDKPDLKQIDERLSQSDGVTNEVYSHIVTRMYVPFLQPTDKRQLLYHVLRVSENFHRSIYFIQIRD